MKKSIDLSLILPCYNEEKIFTESVISIQSVLDGSRLSYEIIFVDDGSRDATPRYIKKLCAHDHRCRALFHPKNTGRGKAVADGFLSARGTIVGYMDIDCEVPPVYIPDIVRMLLGGKVDGVVGKRVYRTTVSSLIREILSVGYKKLVSSLLHTGGMDTESGYKFFLRKKILPVLSECHDPHWFWDTEIIVFSLRRGLRILEYPVLFLRRFDKSSSVRIVSDPVRYVQSILSLIPRLKET